MVRCYREERQVPGFRFPRPHWFPYHVPVPVVVCKTNTDNTAFFLCIYPKIARAVYSGIMTV